MNRNAPPEGGEEAHGRKLRGRRSTGGRSSQDGDAHMATRRGAGRSASLPPEVGRHKRRKRCPYGHRDHGKLGRAYRLRDGGALHAGDGGVGLQSSTLASCFCTGIEVCIIGGWVLSPTHVPLLTSPGEMIRTLRFFFLHVVVTLRVPRALLEVGFCPLPFPGTH